MKELTFVVTEQEANTILAGLGELPAKFSIDVIAKLKRQATEQMNQAPQPEPEAVSEPEKSEV